MPLSEKQRKHLRRLAHPLDPVVMLGNAGLTQGVVAETQRALQDHELVKVSARVGDRKARDAALASLAQQTLAYWSDASYGVFLIHYAVIVAATALWLRLGTEGTGAAWALLALCWAASLAAGAALQRFVGAPLSGIGWARSQRAGSG